MMQWAGVGRTGERVTARLHKLFAHDRDPLAEKLGGQSVALLDLRHRRNMLPITTLRATRHAPWPWLPAAQRAARGVEGGVSRAAGKTSPVR